MKASAELWDKTVVFHGHACPGLAIGYRLTLEGASFLGISERSHDEEIVCIAETDACGIDAAQVLLGCSMGKGNLLLRLRGKNALTFLHRPSKKACRVMWKNPEQSLGLSREDKMRLFLTEPAKNCCSLFEISYPDLPEALVSPSVPCESCGEFTAEHMMRLIKGQKLCLDCVPNFSRVLG